jgi:hypothetical protein
LSGVVASVLKIAVDLEVPSREMGWPSCQDRPPHLHGRRIGQIEDRM